jgi:prevent-host-death family protein
MHVMTARDAKNRFGELMDRAQREPVLITKNNRPVSVMVSFEDIKGTYLEELFMPKEEGHDVYVKNKVETTIRKLDSGEMARSPMQEVHARVLENIKNRLSAAK